MPDGSTYEGVFYANEKNGNFLWTQMDGTKYEVNFKDGIKAKLCHRINSDGTK
jgi:hypothetical protein